MQRCCESFMTALNLRTAAVKHCPMHCDVMLCAVCLQHRHRTTHKKAHYCVGETMREPIDLPEGHSGPERPGDYLRHIVLTTPKTRGCVRAAAETLARWFTWMKRRKAWKSHVRAAMGVFECTGNATDGWGWHVHCLTMGEWWQNQCKVSDVTDERASRRVKFIGPLRRLQDYGTVYERPARPSWGECECVKRAPRGRKNDPSERCLMQEWFQVTGGEARIVHISAAGANHRNGRSSAIAEAIKYVVKTLSLDASAIVDFQIGMKGFQRVRWSGEWYGMQPPDDEGGEPRVMVAPEDLWRRSTGTIGELFARLTTGDEWVLEAATAAGWKLIPFEGPIQEGRARPPPEVELPKAFAVSAVEHLEAASAELDTSTAKYLAEHPDQALPFSVSHVPF